MIMFQALEQSDVFVDACASDQHAQLLFLSVYGRDTSVQQLMARLHQPVSQGGVDAVTLRLPSGKSEALTVTDIRRDAISDEEIVQRLVFSLVNEAAHILEEGIANKASDIDMIYLTGYGFPLFRGGPMLYADEVGLYSVARRMEDFKASSGDSFWEPAPLIAKLVASGKSLT